MVDSNLFSTPKRPIRKHPHHEIIIKDGLPTIVFVTACTKGRVPWLATAAVHDCLISIWRQATAWYVGRYVLMPDAPASVRESRNARIRVWKFG